MWGGVGGGSLKPQAWLFSGGGGGRATAREWRRPGPWPSHKMDTQRDQDAEYGRKRRSTQGGRTQGIQRDLRRSKSQGPKGTWVQAEVIKGRGKRTWDTAVDAGMRHGAQRRATEDGGWQV